MSRRHGHPKLTVETALISTSGSLFWIALGKEVVMTHQSALWETATAGQTFWQFFIGIVQLYLLYGVVRWVLGIIGQRTAETVDATLQVSRTYRDIRDRVATTFADTPRPDTAGNPESEPDRCPS